MSQETIIRLIEEQREDGAIYVSSPEIPLLHVLLKPGEDFETIILPILKEMLERKLKKTVVLRPIDVFNGSELHHKRGPDLPEFVIAQVAGNWESSNSHM